VIGQHTVVLLMQRRLGFEACFVCCDRHLVPRGRWQAAFLKGVEKTAAEVQEAHRLAGTSTIFSRFASKNGARL